MVARRRALRAETHLTGGSGPALARNTHTVVHNPEPGTRSRRPEAAGREPLRGRESCLLVAPPPFVQRAWRLGTRGAVEGRIRCSVHPWNVAHLTIPVAALSSARRRLTGVVSSPRGRHVRRRPARIRRRTGPGQPARRTPPPNRRPPPVFPRPHTRGHDAGATPCANFADAWRGEVLRPVVRSPPIQGRSIMPLTRQIAAASVPRLWCDDTITRTR